MNAEIILNGLLSGVSRNPVLSGLVILVLFSLIQNVVLFRRLRKLMRGGDGTSLESAIRGMQDKIEKLEAHATATNATLKDNNRRITRSIQGVSVKRFDPFQNAGGQQSFATALLNETGDGVVVSGIHARDGVRVYSKEVKAFKSERELSEEETGAIEDSKKNLR